MTTKKYNEIINKWNPAEVLYIRYRTSHSVGKITCSMAFFLEMYKKYTKLLKGVEIREIFVKNEETGIVITYLNNDLFSAYVYATGR